MKNTTTTKIQKQHEENSIKLQPKNKFVNQPKKIVFSSDRKPKASRDDVVATKFKGDPHPEGKKSRN